MTTMWVPPTAARELVEKRRRREAQALLFLQTNAVCEQFNPELEKIDPGLVMVFIPEPMPLDVVASGARPGCYNIVYEGQKGGPLSFLPIIGPDGEYVDPTYQIFDKIRSMDWWNGRVMEDRRRVEGKLEDARRKHEEDEARRADEEVYERFLSHERPQVLFSDQPWSWKNAGRRGIKR